MPKTTESTDITPRQLDVLAQIEAFQRSRCYSATIGELAEALRLSRPTVFEHIAALRAKKLITRSNGRARSLQLTAKARRLIDTARRLEVRRTSSESTAAQTDDDRWLLAGRVCAGLGIEAIEEPQPFSLASVLGCGQGEFVLQVTGSSMIEAGIHDGDYIVCRPSALAENGQIVVALLDGQTVTLKRFYKDRNAVRLQPANDAFEPVISTDCAIRAVVTGVIRRLAIR